MPIGTNIWDLETYENKLKNKNASSERFSSYCCTTLRGEARGNNETRLESFAPLGCSALGSSLIQIDSQLPCQTIALFCYTFCLLESLHGTQLCGSRLGQASPAQAKPGRALGWLGQNVIIIRYTMSWFNGHHQACRHFSWLLQKPPNTIDWRLYVS